MSESRPRILAIDDTPANLLTLGAALAERYDLQTVTSGAMGIELAVKAPPDLILLDVMMPKMDGFETCRRLKAEPALKDVPVVFVTVSSDFESQMEGLSLGAADFISKPIHVEIARQRIGNLLERELLRKKVEAQRDQLKAALVQLQESEERFRQAFVHAPFGMAIVAKDGSIREANPSLCQMLGYRAGEILGRELDQLFLKDSSTPERHSIERLAEGLAVCISEERVGIRKDDRYIPVVRTWSVVRDSIGQPLNYVVQIEDISERKQIQFKELATGVLTAQESERARLSRELHDEIGQLLTALKITLKRAEQNATDQEKTSSFLHDGQDIVERLMSEVRSIAYRLRPSELDQLGLVAALRSHLDKTIRPLGQKVTLEENIGETRLSAALELCCFRVIQEALTNALRYAGTDHLRVSLNLDSSRLVLAVADEGVGFDVGRYYSPHEKPSSLGLIGMRERVAANGGYLQIRSAPSAGTEVVATFDLTPETP